MTLRPNANAGRRVGIGLLAGALLVLSGCSLSPLRPPDEVLPSNARSDATLTPSTRITRDLVRLPPPKFRVPVAVYAFRDQTGQFKPQPDSNLSASVTQGAASILVKALLDSGWYLPIEREGFQNLLNERRVARAIETPTDKGKAGSSFPQLVSANFIVEGGIVGYESNVRTGGEGANLLGIGGSTRYRVDQVTVNLRSVDVRSGQIANSVSVTKTIYSHEVSASVYKFVSYKTLLQAEGGYSTNEPSQLAVKEAIESAVIHLTVQGIRDRVWALRQDQDWHAPLLQNYLREAESELRDPDQVALRSDGPVDRRPLALILPPPVPLGFGVASSAGSVPVAAATAAAPAPAAVPAVPAAAAAPVASTGDRPKAVPSASPPSATPATAPVVLPAPAAPAEIPRPRKPADAPIAPLITEAPAQPARSPQAANVLRPLIAQLMPPIPEALNLPAAPLAPKTPSAATPTLAPSATTLGEVSDDGSGLFAAPGAP